MSSKASSEELFIGHKACGGCGGSLAIRLALKALGRDTVIVLPAGCMSAVSFIYPQMAFGVNALISTFPGTASMLSGLRAGLDAKGREDVTVLGFAGDGGTADIGLQALSGAIDRRERILYVCYDNEAYMNTGVQMSSLTVAGARTTTTPSGRRELSRPRPKKNMFEIVAANGIAYAATASVGFPEDFMRKLRKAAAVRGTSYVHVFAPCPTGWGCASDLTVALAREAVECGMWYLAEFEGGAYRLEDRRKPGTSVSEYLKKQGRFSSLGLPEIESVANEAAATIARIGRLAAMSQS